MLENKKNIIFSTLTINAWLYSHSNQQAASSFAPCERPPLQRRTQPPNWPSTRRARALYARQYARLRCPSCLHQPKAPCKSKKGIFLACLLHLRAPLSTYECSRIDKANLLLFVLSHLKNHLALSTVVCSSELSWLQIWPQILHSIQWKKARFTDTKARARARVHSLIFFARARDESLHRRAPSTWRLEYRGSSQQRKKFMSIRLLCSHTKLCIY